MGERVKPSRLFYNVSQEEDRKIWSMDRASRGAKIGAVGGFVLGGVIGGIDFIVEGNAVSFLVMAALDTAGMSGYGAMVDGFKPTSRMMGNKGEWSAIVMAKSVVHDIKNRRNRK